MPSSQPSKSTESESSQVPRMKQLLLDRLKQMVTPDKEEMVSKFFEPLAHAIAAWVRHDLAFHDGETKTVDSDNEFEDFTIGSKTLYGRPTGMVESESAADPITEKLS